MVLPTGLLILRPANVFTVIARALAVPLDSFATDRDGIFCRQVLFLYLTIPEEMILVLYTVRRVLSN